MDFGGLVEDEEVGGVELEDVGDEMQGVVLDDELEIEQGRETMPILVHTIDLLELAHRPPRATTPPPPQRRIMLRPHKPRHERINILPQQFLSRATKHVIDVAGSVSNHPDRFDLHAGLDRTAYAVVDHLAELF